MLFYKTVAEIQVIKENCQLLSDLFRQLESFLKPKVEMNVIDNFAYQYLIDHDAKPVFLNYNDSFKFKNKAFSFIVHNAPGRIELLKGDIISIKCQIFKDGFFGYLSRTFTVDELETEQKMFLLQSNQIVRSAIECLKEGNRSGDFAENLYKQCLGLNFNCLRKQLGYGLGRNRLENPVLKHYLLPRSGVLLKRGMVFAINPVIYFESRQTNWFDNGWALNNKNGRIFSQFGYTVAVGLNKGKILSEYIETKNRK